LTQKKQKVKAAFIFTPFFDQKLGNKKTPSGRTAFVSNPISDQKIPKMNKASPNLPASIPLQII
jgi:hypothetical protein